MKLLEERILKDGKVFPGNILKVDSFLNHQIDVSVISAMSDEFYRLYGNDGINKILTIEASGIAIAAIVAERFNVPLIFAKKSQTKNISSSVYTSKVHSYTHGKDYDIVVSKEFLHENDKVLLIDDFLANGQALLGLIELCKSAGAQVIGAGIAIEKCFQTGGELIRSTGVRVESLAMVESLSDGKVTFRK